MYNAGYFGVTKFIYFASNSSYFPTTHTFFTCSHNATVLTSTPAVELISSHLILCKMSTPLTMMYQQVGQSLSEASPLVSGVSSESLLLGS